jgi:hypothetical protein
MMAIFPFEMWIIGKIYDGNIPFQNVDNWYDMMAKFLFYYFSVLVLPKDLE